MKKFYIFLSVLLLSLFWLVGTYSFASVNYSQLEEFNFNGNSKEMLEQCIYKISNFNLEDYGNKVRSSDQDDWALLLSVFNNSSYVSFYYTLNSQANADSSLSNPNAMNFMCFSNNSWNSGNGYNFTIYRKSLTETRINSSTITSQSIAGNINTSYASKFLFVSDKWYKAIGNNWLPPQPQLNFVPLSNVIKNIGGINFYIQNFTRYETFFKIGQLSNFDYREYYHGICAMLVNGVYQNSNIQLYINPNGEVFVYTSNLLFNQGYGFKFFNGELETDIYNFYFISNGQTSGDIISSGDYVYNGFDNNDLVPVANIINSQYEVNSGEIIGTLDSIFPSGDVSTIANAYDYYSYENNYFAFLYGFFNNIIEKLTSSGEQSLTIRYRDYNTTLYSGDFFVPNSPLKTLVTTILIVFTYFLIMQQLDSMFKHIREMNIHGFLHDTDVDYHFFL